MIKRCLILTLLLLLPLSAFAATIQIADNAGWQSLTPVRGNTYVLATGTYGSKTLSTAASGSDEITIQSGGTVTFSGGAALTITTDYWNIDGVTGGGPGSWKSGHGIVFTTSAGTSIEYISISDGVSYITLGHIEFNQVGDTTASGDRANGLYAAGSLSNSTIEYCYFKNLGGLPFLLRNGTTNIIQYNYSGDICGMSVFNVNNHCEVLVLHDMDDVHFRWNFINEAPSTGGFVKNNVQTSTDIRIYGNVIANGNPISCNSGTGTNWRIFNNTFSGINQGFTQGDCSHSGFLEYNNVVFDSTGSALWDTRDYQWYSQTSNLSYTMGFGANTNCTDQPGTCPETDDPFINSSGDEPEDFQLSAALSGYDGTDSCVLDACTGEKKYNIDMFGNTRGADGTWDRGAIEYDATPTNTITGVNIN